MKLSILFSSILLMISQSLSPLHSRDADGRGTDANAHSQRLTISHISIPLGSSPLSDGLTSDHRTLPPLPGAVQNDSPGSFESEQKAASTGSLPHYTHPGSPVSPLSVIDLPSPRISAIYPTQCEGF